MPTLASSLSTKLRDVLRSAGNSGQGPVSAENLLRQYPDFPQNFVEPFRASDPFTMTSPDRQYALWGAVQHVVEKGIEGEFVECGVWRGGSSMIVANALKDLGHTDKGLWLFDTFEGMPEAADNDVDISGNSANTLLSKATQGDRENPVLAFAGLEEVKRNMASTGYPADKVHFIKGLVEETIPAQAPEKIALLRLDTDWESSTRHELEHLWSRLAVGGILIIDDYGHWAGARRAVDEFFAGRDDAPFLVRIDYTGRIAVKAA